MQTAKAVFCSLAVLAPLALASRPVQAETDFDKTYPLHGRPMLTLSAGDSGLEVRSCGNCSSVHIRVEWNDRKSSEYTITESQTGNSVSFALREKPSIGMHIRIGNHRAPHVYVDSPAEADVEARTSDGSLKVAGIHGNLTLHTSDGSMEATDVSGALRLTSNDGSMHIHNAAGTLESRSSDGHVAIEGRFTAVQIHTSDGGLDLSLAEGTQLAAPSRIESSDGSVNLHLPGSLAADLEVSTSDGSVDCQLPLTMNGYNSSGASKHRLRGHLNGGGPSLEIHTSDGSVKISRL